LQFSLGAEKTNCNDINGLTFKSDRLLAHALRPRRSKTFSGRRDLVAAKMTPDQIAEAQRMAREWKPK
jgi:hypothetical protein